MKLFLSGILLLMFSLAQASNKLYNQTIYASAIEDSQYKQSVQDLKFYLSKITNHPYSIVYTNEKKTEGIIIKLNFSIPLTENYIKRLKNGTIEDFIVEGNAKQLVLTANHPLGLSRAIYTYLDRLGVKWYYPGAEWELIPSLADITINTLEYITPAFHLRDFFGTGGIVSMNFFDASGSLQNEWDIWKRRNRMGGQFILGGHYGESFNLKYKSLLETHPEFLALSAGKRQWTETAKWCISNAAFRALFINDRLEEGKKRLQQVIYPNEQVVVSADPSDGGGDCECDNCKKFGPPSERTFYLANEVALQMEGLSPQLYTNLYAYSTHAAPPSFHLSNRLIVQMVPYAFQKVGTPDVMIKKWKTVAHNLYLYDYYGLPDWHWDKPLTNEWSVNVLEKKIKYWKSSGLQGFTLESSYSIAVTGLGLYMASRLGWNENEKSSSITKDICEALFGRAASYMKMYFDKIENDFSGEPDLPYLVNLVKQASDADNTAVVSKRLNLYKAYLHYLALCYSWEKATPSDRESKGEIFYQYVWKFYASKMIHSTRIAQMLVQKLKDQKRWRMYEPIGNGLKQVRPLEEADIQNNFKQDQFVYPLLEGFEYVRKNSGKDFYINDRSNKKNANPVGMLILNFPQTFVKPKQNGLINFLIKVNESSLDNKTQIIKIELRDTVNGYTLFTEEVKIDTIWKEVAIKAAAGKTYQLYVTNANWIRFSVLSDQWLAFKNIPTYSDLGNLWFYHSGHSKFLYFSNNGSSQLIVINDQLNKKIEIENTEQKNIYKAVVGIQPKWICICSVQYQFLKFYSPSLFFPHSNIAVR